MDYTPQLCLKATRLASFIFQLVIFILSGYFNYNDHKSNGFVHTVGRLAIKQEQLHPNDLPD